MRFSRQFHSSVAAVLGLMAGVPFTGNAAEPTDTTAVIACWNVKAKPNPIPVSRAKRIAKGIAMIDAEVIVLSEVSPHNRIDTIVTELTALGANYAKVMPTQMAELGIAILHKNNVAVTNPRLVPGSADGQPDRHRKALAADVKVGNFDFILIGVHLKSASNGHDIRDRQCEKIAEFITNSTAGSEKDVLVVGDYNMVPRQVGSRDDSSNFTKLGASGFLDFISRPRLCMRGTHISGNSLGNFLDGFGISKDHTKEYVGGSIRAFPLNKAFDMSLGQYSSSVSDHLPLVARFNVAGVDDD